MISVPIVLNVNVMSGQTTIYILVSIAAILILAGFIYMCRTLCLPSLKEKCCMELEKKDDNPDYGTYYYSDGDKRQDIMEVTLYKTIKSSTESI